jgi:hypothetical protein
MNIEKSRFGFSTITPNAKLGNITTNIEFEAKGAYEDREVGLKLRQATVGFGNLIIGRTGSTFIDTDAGPETLSPAAPIGQPNFDVSNFNLIRYAAPINQHISFAVSLEDGVSKPDQVVNFLTESEGKGYTHSSKCPTMVGALTYSDSWGHVGIRVLEQKWSVYHDCSTTPGHSRSSFATQLSSAVNVGKDKLVGTVYAGKGLGAYGTGTTSESQIMVANDKSYKVILNDQVGWQLGYTHNWNDKVRSNLVSSRVNMIKSDFNPYLKNARDYVVNTIVNVAKGVEFGLEYMLQKTKINNDFEPISSYSKTNDARPDSRRLYSNRIAAVLTAKF